MLKPQIPVLALEGKSTFRVILGWGGCKKLLDVGPRRFLLRLKGKYWDLYGFSCEKTRSWGFVIKLVCHYGLTYMNQSDRCMNERLQGQTDAGREGPSHHTPPGCKMQHLLLSKDFTLCPIKVW